MFLPFRKPSTPFEKPGAHFENPAMTDFSNSGDSWLLEFKNLKTWRVL